jgi:hypothetical protein
LFEDGLFGDGLFGDGLFGDGFFGVWDIELRGIELPPRGAAYEDRGSDPTVPRRCDKFYGETFRR